MQNNYFDQRRGIGGLWKNFTLLFLLFKQFHFHSVNKWESPLEKRCGGRGKIQEEARI
jgi:hypothetical protein